MGHTRAVTLDKVGQLVTGTVQQVDRGNALVFLDRRTEAILPAREQVRREYLRQGEQVRSLLLDVGLPVRYHRALFVLALVGSAVGFAAVWAGYRTAEWWFGV